MSMEQRAYREGSFPKRCGCGQSYTQEQWQALPLAGIWQGEDETCGRRFGPDLELRNCSCRSSIAVPLESA